MRSFSKVLLLMLLSFYCALCLTLGCDTTRKVSCKPPLKVKLSPKERKDFIQAAEAGNLEKVNAYIARGVDLEQTTEYSNRRVLWYATRGGHIEVVNALLLAGADPNKKGDATYPLNVAASSDVKLVELLIKYGAKINTDDCTTGSPIFDAASSDQVEICKLLIAKGANTKQRCRSEHATVLHWAGIKTAALFLERGLDVNALDKEGKTPLHCAAIMGKPVLVEFLLKNGAKVNAQDKYGRTALHYIAKAHCQHYPWPTSPREVIRVLLKHNASRSIKDKRGLTPADMALSGEDFKLVDLLVE